MQGRTRTQNRLLQAVFVALLAVAMSVFAVGCSGGDTSTSGAADSQTTNEAAATTQTVTDDAGRTVEIPTAENITSVYCTSPIAEVAMFAFAPEKLGGVNSDYTEEQLKYLPEGVSDLPNYGTWANNGTLDEEAIMAGGIQVILDVSSAAITDSDIDTANELQERTGIPVLLYDGSVENTPDTYRSIGTVFDMADRGEELAQYCENAKADVEAAVAEIPEEDRVRVYYAEGPDGLKTEPQDSPHFTTYAEAGAISVAECDLTKGSGLTQVSLENVIAWNPDVIIAWSESLRGGADETIRTSSDWESIAAVQNDQVYTIPAVPFMWGDRPPSVTRYLGMQWMANLLYPEQYDVDMVAVTKEFYELFFNVTLSDDEAQAVLNVE